MRTKAQRPCQAPFRIACGGLQGRNGFIVLAARLGLLVQIKTSGRRNGELWLRRKKVVLEGNYNREPGADCQQRTAVHLERFFFSSKPFQWDLHKMHKSFWRFATGSRVGPGSRTTRSPAKQLSLFVRRCLDLRRPHHGHTFFGFSETGRGGERER